MAAYLRDTRRHCVMSRQEEHDVAVAFVTTGDRRFATRLVNANLRLVVKIALEYRGERRVLMDLIQEGNVGLIHAVEKYDPSRGTKLGTYASWWIRAYVLKFIVSNSRLVKIGTTQAQRRLFFGMRKTRARLQLRDSSPVEHQELARAMDVPEAVVVEMEQRMAFGEASLDARSRQGTADTKTYGDSFCADPTLQPDSQFEAKELRDLMKGTLATFTATLAGRDLEIFRSRMSLEKPLTLAVLAKKFDVSAERVRQLEERLKAKMRQHLAEKMGDSLPAVTPRPRRGAAARGRYARRPAFVAITAVVPASTGADVLGGYAALC